MNTILIILVWLLVAFVIGIAFGKFCAAVNAFDPRYVLKFDIESNTLVDNLTPIEGSAEEAA